MHYGMGGLEFYGFVGMITWNHALQTRYPNLLILAKLAHVQYVSTTMCEHAFSVQNLIKTRVINNWAVRISRPCYELPWKGQMRG